MEGTTLRRSKWLYATNAVIHLIALTLIAIVVIRVNVHINRFPDNADWAVWSGVLISGAVVLFDIVIVYHVIEAYDKSRRRRSSFRAEQARQPHRLHWPRRQHRNAA